MEQPEIKFCLPEMDQTELFWAGVQETDDFLGDLELSLASGTSCGFQENVQKYTLLDLEPPLVERIKKLATTHPYPKQRHS